MLQCFSFLKFFRRCIEKKTFPIMKTIIVLPISQEKNNLLLRAHLGTSLPLLAARAPNATEKSRLKAADPTALPIPVAGGIPTKRAPRMEARIPGAEMPSARKTAPVTSGLRENWGGCKVRLFCAEEVRIVGSLVVQLVANYDLSGLMIKTSKISKCIWR